MVTWVMTAQVRSVTACAVPAQNRVPGSVLHARMTRMSNADGTTVINSDPAHPAGWRKLLMRFSDIGVPVIAVTTVPPYLHHTVRAAGITSVLLRSRLPNEVAAAIRVALGVPQGM